MILKKIIFLIAIIGICQTTIAEKIYDAKHFLYIVAGNTYDGNIYHQPHQNRENANWTLIPTGEPETYYIQDGKHLAYIVAGDTYNGHIYHQYNLNRENAKWRKIPDPIREGWYWLVDKKHFRAIVAGDDGNLYHQYPQFRENASWKIE
jgi:hypothetical protein